MNVTDMLGQEYTVGDFVVYATTAGQSPILKLARVAKITEDEKGRPRVGVRRFKNGRGFNDGLYSYSTGTARQAHVSYPTVGNIVKVNYAGPDEEEPGPR